MNLYLEKLQHIKLVVKFTVSTQKIMWYKYLTNWFMLKSKSLQLKHILGKYNKSWNKPKKKIHPLTGKYTNVLRKWENTNENII